jgi:hypothetical protein
LLRTQDKALDKFKVYKAEVENLLDCKIKTLRSDKGVNILANILTIFDNGIVHQQNTPYTPQQNNVIEMKNITFIDMVNVLLDRSGWFA